MTIAFSAEQAKQAISQLHQAAQNIELPPGFKLSHFDENYLTKQYEMNMKWKSPHTSVSAHINGNFDNSKNRHFSSEIRLFMRESDNGRYVIECMLFARLGQAYAFRSKNLLESQEQGDTCPFIYGQTVEEVLTVASDRMQKALATAEETIYEV